MILENGNIPACIIGANSLNNEFIFGGTVLYVLYCTLYKHSMRVFLPLACNIHPSTMDTKTLNRRQQWRLISDK